MFFRAAAVGLAALALGACSRPAKRPIERLAILRFENLSPDTAPDWIGRALSEVVAVELGGSKSVYAIPAPRLHQMNAAMGARAVSAPGISTEAALAAAVGATRVGYGDYSILGGRLRARLTIDDADAPRASRAPIEVVAGAGDVIGAATALAKAISADAQPYGTANESALEAYVQAMEAPEPSATLGAAEQAIGADPNFGSAYTILAETRLKLQDRAGAAAALQAALARGDAMRPMDRARAAIVDATARGDGAAMGNALALLVKAAPLDPVAWRAVAAYEAERRRYAEAVQAYNRAAAVEPEDATTWNEMGYTAAYAGNFDAAIAAARRYQALRPADPNPLDTLGDIQVMAGRLQDAEQLYLAAYKKSPGFLGGADLFKAAMARLMTGDVAGADGIARQGKGELASSAEWMWLSGRRREAFARLSAEAPRLPREAQSRAYAELAIWAALMGDRAAASSAGQQAVATATQAGMPVAAVAKFMTLPSASEEEWRSRAGQMFPNAPANSIRDYALAYALLLDGKFAAATPLLEQMYARTPANGDRGPAIELAWALIETGKAGDAAPLLKLNPVPNFGPTSVFTPLYFPRLFQLRSAVGDRAEENRRIYAALGGK